MIDTLVKLRDYVPVFQTILWIFLVVVLLLIYRVRIGAFFELVVKRVKGGSGFKAGPLEIGPELRSLEYAERTAEIQEVGTGHQDREDVRTDIYKRNKGLFLTHIISPSEDPNQKYDIFIYLIRHKSENFADIDRAEFFFGHMWGNRVFSEKEKNGIIGVATSAYAPFLCTCTVVFEDETIVELHRYIDFEAEAYLRVQARNP